MMVKRPGPGTPVTVMGLAKSGLSAARFLLQMGCEVRVTEKGRSAELEAQAKALERAGAFLELGGHTSRFFRGAHLVVVSPGVPLDSPPMRWVRAAQIPVVSEQELGSWYAPGRIVAVTGSNGKSTVVTLLGEILKAAGKEAVVCGNIGIPLTSVLDQLRPSSIIVLETSSFQLEASLSFHPEIACLLNLTGNHLDRHGTFRRYREAKAKLFSYQSKNAAALLNADDPVSWDMRSLAKCRRFGFSRRRRVVGAFLAEGELQLDLPGFSGTICRRDQLSRTGAHDQENALAAACMAGLLGVEPSTTAKALQTFQGLPHRQELVATIRGVAFVNDSKSTTLASGLSAIQAASGEVILIAGGRDKGSNFRKLVAFKKKLRAAVLIGEDGPKIASALQGSVQTLRAHNLKEAVDAAAGLARPGGCVLLSPMCTSFDMFRDFEERGERFKEAVGHLMNGGAAA